MQNNSKNQIEILIMTAITQSLGARAVVRVCLFVCVCLCVGVGVHVCEFLYVFYICL